MLVSPDRSHAHFPFAFVARLLSAGSNTMMLLFNVIADGAVPKSKKGARLSFAQTGCGPSPHHYDEGMTASPSFFDKLAQAGTAVDFSKLTEQKLRIIRQAELAGARLLACWDEGQYEQRATSARWQAKMHGSLPETSAQVFVFETGGIRHLFFQPYSSKDPLPGVHHFWIEGSTRNAVFFDHEHGAFNAGNDWQLAQWLGQTPLAQVLRSIDWSYTLHGSTRIHEPVVFQVRPMGRGLGHVTVRATDGNPLDGHGVGFRLVPRIAQALKVSGLESVAEPQAFLSFAPATDEYIAAVEDTLELPTPGPTIDVSAALAAVFRPGVKSHLLHAPLPPKKEKGARTGIVPPWLQDQPILALDDRTVFGGGDRGTVLLPTHMCHRSEEGHFTVSYGDITGASFIVNTLVIRTRQLGDLAFHFPEAERLAPMLQHFATG